MFGKYLWQSGKAFFQLNKKRILYICSTDEKGGANIALNELISRLKPCFEAVVVTPPPRKGIPQMKFNGSSVKIRHLRMGIINAELRKLSGIARFLLHLFSGSAELIRLIRKEQIGLIHVNAANAVTGGIVTLVSGIPCLWQVHEILAPPAIRVPVYGFISLVSKRTVAISESVKEAFPKWARRNILVVCDSVDTSRFRPEIDGIAVRHELGIPIEAPVAGLIGRFAPRKGHPDFVDACAKLVQNHRHAHFIMAGQTFPAHESYLEDLKRRVREYGLESRMHFMFWREDVPAITAALDVAVMASVQPEGFGLVIIEAMAMNKPVVATKIGGVTDYITDDAGILIPAGNSDALAKAIDTLFNGPDRAALMGIAGGRLVHRLFSAEKRIRDFERIYDNLF